MSNEDQSILRIYGIVTDSIVDGPGFRTAIFTQGCTHHCAGCHNPDSHPMDGGKDWTLDEIEAKFTNNPLLDGITLTGGDPFMQPAGCAELARRAHAKGLNVWAYTGYTYEQLQELATNNRDIADLVDQCDVLVDGRFILAERSLDLVFTGSRNQRLIDIAKTRDSGSIVLYEAPQW